MQSTYFINHGAQPHENHLLPLMVAAGAASAEPGQTAFHGHALGKPISGFRFGSPFQGDIP